MRELFPSLIPHKMSHSVGNGVCLNYRVSLYELREEPVHQVVFLFFAKRHCVEVKPN